MSTEVESTQFDSGLTAESNQNKSEKPTNTNTRDHEENTEKHVVDPHTSTAADTHKKCKENDKENDQSSKVADSTSTVETVKRKVVEAPPPKVNPWTKRTTGRVPSNNINNQEKDQQNALKVVRASKPRTRKSSKSSDFSDITNWPTPGELAKEQQQNVLNNNGKKPPSSSSSNTNTTTSSSSSSSRRDKEKRRERPDRKSESSHDGGESKENQEAQPDPLGELPKDGDAKTGSDAKNAGLKKRGGEGEESSYSSVKDGKKMHDGIERAS